MSLKKEAQIFLIGCPPGSTAVHALRAVMSLCLKRKRSRTIGCHCCEMMRDEQQPNLGRFFPKMPTILSATSKSTRRETTHANTAGLPRSRFLPPPPFSSPSLTRQAQGEKGKETTLTGKITASSATSASRPSAPPSSSPRSPARTRPSTSTRLRTRSTTATPARSPRTAASPASSPRRATKRPLPPPTASTTSTKSDAPRSLRNTSRRTRRLCPSRVLYVLATGTRSPEISESVRIAFPGSAHTPSPSPCFIVDARDDVAIPGNRELTLAHPWA